MFQVGGIVAPEFFVGRRNEIAAAERILRERQSLLIVGEFRDGKTSFCQMLIRRMKSGDRPSILPVYMNVQFWPDITLETFLEHTILGIIGEIAREVFHCKYTDLPRVESRQGPVDAGLRDLAQIFSAVRQRTFFHEGKATSPFTTTDFLQYHSELMGLLSHRGWTNCVVFYDEANKLPDSLTLDRMIAHNEAVAMSGGTSVYVASPSMLRAHCQLRHTIPHCIEVGPFTDIADMRELLARYCLGDSRLTEKLPLTQKACDLIWLHAHGRPFLIQMVANHSFARAHERRTHIVDVSDVQHAVDTLRHDRPELFPGTESP
jgi:hypothetical protein